MKKIVAIVTAGLALAGCVAGHTHNPAEAERPLPVTFFAGHVVSVTGAALGTPNADATVTVGFRPGEVVGVHAAAGPQPAGGRVSVTAGGVDIGPGVGAPGAAYEYTVALDGTPQVVQISQLVLPEDCQMAPPPGCFMRPGDAVVVRVVGNTARVLPRHLVPLEFQALIVNGPMVLPLGSRNAAFLAAVARGQPIRWPAFLPPD